MTYVESETALLDRLIGSRGLLPTLHWCYTHFRPARVAANNADGYTWRTPLQGIKGFPDIVAVKQFAGVGRVVWMECKGETEKPTQEQVTWLDLLLAAGEEVYLARPSDWDELAWLFTMGHKPNLIERAELKCAWSNRRAINGNDSA